MAKPFIYRPMLLPFTQQLPPTKRAPLAKRPEVRYPHVPGYRAGQSVNEPKSFC